MSSDADIESQAAAWVARCDARGFDQEPALAAWLAADPRHRAAYLRLARAWERAESLARLRPANRLIDPDLLAPRPRARPRARSRRPAGGVALDGVRAGRLRRAGAPGRRWRRSAAAALVLAVTVALTLLHVPPSWATQTYRTGPHGLSRVVLADGSAVTLNADTLLRVHFTAARRTLMLLRGEAHFSVTHDAHRPFEVHARDRIVVAVGTAFDVRLEPDDVQVTVTQGRVALIDRAEPARADAQALQTIVAGQDALFTMQKVTVQHVDSATVFRRLAWERRELLFEGQTLHEAVSRFERFTNRRIVIDDPAIGSLQIGGSFRALDVASFVAALGHAFGISSRTGPHGTIHLYRARRAQHPYRSREARTSSPIATAHQPSAEWGTVHD